MENDDQVPQEGDAEKTEVQELGSIKLSISAPPVVRNLMKVVERLGSASIDTFIAGREARSAELRLKAARDNVLGSVLARIPQDQMHIGVKIAERLVDEQHRVDQIVIEAVRWLEESEDPEAGGSGAKEVDDDWIEIFRREAGQRSQSEVRKAFARILAGEIREPGTFSIRTLRTVAGLSQSTATAFSHAASIRLEQRFTVRHPDGRREHKIEYPMVPDLEGKGRPCDLSSEYFVELVENGLLQSIVGSVYYGAAAVDPVTDVVHMPFTHQNRRWGLKPIPPGKRPEELRISGACFTSVGAELLRIVDIEESDLFLDRLRGYFRSRLWEMVPVEDSRK